jgi:hypothetical protein
MTRARPDKVLVTNEGVLKTKYGAAYKSAIKPAIAALIAADKARGMNTVLVPLDVARAMAKYHARRVTTATDPKQNKTAIDGVYKALTPAYLCILGAVDVVPHQDLVNPISSDGDALVPSDLPYACDHTYSQRVEDFLQPTRVVGRLPDLTGGGNAAYLTGLLGTAAAAQSLPQAQYLNYLGITAQVWTASTQQSLQNVFGNSTALQGVPPKGPPWTSLIGRLSHFINCHGAPADPHFYGQQGNNYPVAHDAAKLSGLATGTVAGVECCYGAELYDPALAGGQPGICNTYLGLGAHGFFGSSTIAYGPASGNGQADRICQFFLRSVLTGASVGEATLQARLDYLKVLSVADPPDLKTLAQFSLMGDPSLHPVQAVPTGQSVVEGRVSKALTGAALRTDPSEVNAASRPLRRRHLAVLGWLLGSAVAPVRTDSRQPTTGGVKALLEAELAKLNTTVREVVSFGVRQPRPAGAKGPARAAVATGVDSVHVAVGELPREGAPFRRLYVVVAREQDRQLLLRHLFSR